MAKDGGKAKEASIGRDPDGHLHAFVFVDHTPEPVPEILKALSEFRRRSFPRIRWAGSTIGDYTAFVHVEHDRDSLPDLQHFLDVELWDRGIRCKKALEVAVLNARGTKRETPKVISLVGITAEQGMTRRVAERLAEIDIDRGQWFQGASVVTGDLDIVLQFNADSLDEAMNRLFLDEEFAGLLGGVEGIASTSTAIADGTAGPWAEEWFSES